MSPYLRPRKRSRISQPIHATAGIEHGRCYFYKIIGFQLPGPYPVHIPSGDKNLHNSNILRIYPDLYTSNLSRSIYFESFHIYIIRIYRYLYPIIGLLSTTVHHYRLPFKGIEWRNWTPLREGASLGSDLLGISIWRRFIEYSNHARELFEHTLLLLLGLIGWNYRIQCHFEIFI